MAFVPKENGITNYRGFEIEHEGRVDCGDFVVSVGISCGKKHSSLAHAINEGIWSEPWDLPLTAREQKVVAEIEAAYIAADLY